MGTNSNSVGADTLLYAGPYVPPHLAVHINKFIMYFYVLICVFICVHYVFMYLMCLLCVEYSILRNFVSCSSELLHLGEEWGCENP